MRIKGAASWGWDEAKLWVLRPMEGLPDTGSNPAQMDIGVSYNSRVHREDYIECVSGVSRPRRGVYQFYEENSQSKLSQGMWEVFAR